MIPLNINILDVIISNIEELPPILVTTNTTSSITMTFLYKYKDLPLIEILAYTCDGRTYEMVEDIISRFKFDLYRSEYFREIYRHRLVNSSLGFGTEEPCTICGEWLFYDDIDELNEDSCAKCGDIICQPCYKQATLVSVRCIECDEKFLCSLCVNKKVKKGKSYADFKCHDCHRGPAK